MPSMIANLPSALPLWPDSSNLFDQFLAREKTLVIFAVWMVAIAIAFFIAGALDERLWRGSPIWNKPLKFAISTVVFALTTAWWIGLLPSQVRASNATQLLVWTLIITASFEVAYIGFQAALGQGSHHNTSTRWHAAMFGLMGLAAVALTATQAWLAVLISLQYRGVPMPAGVLGVVIGLVMTTVLGTISGMALGGNQPPAGVGIPFLGWHLDLKDFRPAHFLGLHAHQLVPLMVLVITATSFPWQKAAVIVASAVYLWGWFLLM